MRTLRDIFRRTPRREEEILPVGTLGVPDPAEDADLFSLMEELQELGQVHPCAAARHRGWIAVRTEVRAREARGAFAPAERRSRGRRLALGSAAALVALGLAVVAILNVGTPGAGPGIADTSLTTATTALADLTTTTEPSSTTGATSPRTTPTTPGSTIPASSSTSGSPSTGATGTGPGTVPAPTTSTPPRSVTTLPPSSTTSLQLMTEEERERSATAASAILAQAVLSGDTGAATAVTASSAARGLVQMKTALLDPSSYTILSAEDTGPSFAQVLVEFKDTDAGETVLRRFLFEVRVDRAGALIVGIYFDSSE